MRPQPLDFRQNDARVSGVEAGMGVDDQDIDRQDPFLLRRTLTIWRGISMSGSKKSSFVFIVDGAGLI